MKAVRDRFALQAECQGEWVCESYPNANHNPNAGSSAGVLGSSGVGVHDHKPKPKSNPITIVGSNAGVWCVAEKGYEYPTLMSQPGLDNGTAQNSWQSLHHVFLLLICFLRESHIGQGLTGLPWWFSW